MMSATIFRLLVGAIYTYSEIFLLYHGEQLLVVEETKEN
jgi:hypothetical protein